MVRAVDEHNHCRSAGYFDVASTIVGEGLSVDHPKRRVKSQRFLDDLSGKLELRHVGVSQWPVA